LSVIVFQGIRRAHTNETKNDEGSRVRSPSTEQIEKEEADIRDVKDPFTSVYLRKRRDEQWTSRVGKNKDAVWY
jgi:hypothetical protein